LYPDFIRGYDMVGEEDQGHTLLFHSDSLINAFNHSRISQNSFNLIFHAGETNWPEEHLPNHGDGVSTFENIYDALVLRTRRIGHGLSLAKRPDMYEYIRERQIAIEVCPASNQILGNFYELFF
jgi:adenosine deaminase CECR1